MADRYAQIDVGKLDEKIQSAIWLLITQPAVRMFSGVV